jgi:hypothetical protein
MARQLICLAGGGLDLHNSEGTRTAGLVLTQKVQIRSEKPTPDVALAADGTGVTISTTGKGIEIVS